MSLGKTVRDEALAALFFFFLPLLFGLPPAWAEPTWSVVPPVAYPDTSNDVHGQSVTTYGMTVLLDGATFDPAADYWLRFVGRRPLLACKDPVQPPSRAPLDLTRC